MNDLRHDPDAPAELPVRGYSVVDDWMLRHDPNAHAIDARNLRTVPAPNLRSPDCRTADDKLRAELVRIVDALQALTLRVDGLESGDESTWQAWEVAKLRYYTEALEGMLSSEQRAAAVDAARAALAQHNPPAWVQWGRA